jgi:UDP-N-acetylglucosamine 4-epimerase
MVNLAGTHRWLVTGAAGFIGMHLVDFLLRAGQSVVGVDNFITGKRVRLEYLQKRNSPENWARFTFVEGDILDSRTCAVLCQGIDFVFHQAALGSVPRSVKDPLNTHRHNVDGFVNILNTAKDSGVKRFVYASSSSVYGDEPNLPKNESRIGQPLSPYAATKRINEIYAQVFQRTYGMESIGLRYFNVFGPAQDPAGPYAAVIPVWIDALMSGREININGDGTFSRDFCFVANAVNANILAAIAPSSATGLVYNIACGEKTDLNQLFEVLRDEVGKRQPRALEQKAHYREQRAGDIPHSLANVALAERNLGYKPDIYVRQGLALTVEWYLNNSFMFT